MSYAYGEFRDEGHVIRWAVWKDVLKRAGITRPSAGMPSGTHARAP